MCSDAHFFLEQSALLTLAQCIGRAIKTFVTPLEFPLKSLAYNLYLHFENSLIHLVSSQE